MSRWTNFKKQLPFDGQVIEVEFNNGRIVKGKVEGNWIKHNPKDLDPETMTSGQKRWRVIGEFDEKVEEEVIETKYCGKCDKTKSIDEFFNNKRTKDGKSHFCKKCQIQGAKDSSKSLKDSRRGRAKKPKRKGREVLNDPKIVDPKNRPSKAELKSNRGGGKDGQMEKIVYEMIDLIKSGVSLDGCIDIFSERINPNTQRPFHERFLQDCVLRANKLIKQVYEINKADLIGVHIQRYDQEIQRLLAIPTPREEDFAKPKHYWAAFNQKCMGMSQCLDALQQKEKLLGMHTKSFKLVINNEEETIVKEKKLNIDISQLTLEEKIELNELLEKSRRTDDEISGVILRTEKDNVVEDVEHEVISERSNVDRMENRQPKPIIETHPEGLVLESIQEKMNRRLNQLAKKAFEEKGSKTVEFDKIPEV